MAYEKDISSRRISPLLAASVAGRGENELCKLLCVLLVIASRSTNWRQEVENYILSQPKNSIYLLVVFGALLRRLKHGIHTREDKKTMIDLVGVALARHETGSKKPSKALIEKASRRVYKDDRPV